MQPSNKAGKADAWFHKAFLAHQAGRLAEAESLYLRVLQKTPRDMETLYLLGTACSQQEKYDDAVRYLRKAVELEPRHPDALNNLGLTLKMTRREEESVPYFERALAARPDYPEALSNLGGALQVLKRYDEAEACLRRALQLMPGLVDAHHNLGMVLRECDRFQEAADCFQVALRLNPRHWESFNELGSVYKLWGRLEEARACFEKALSFRPDAYKPQHNLGATLEELGLLDEARAAYERAMTLNPDNISTKWNWAYLYLRQGILDKGWAAYEQRLDEAMAITKRRYAYPDWDGGPLAGKTILVYAEQGLGDEILFASCLPDVIDAAAHVVIECDPRLAPLYARSFPQATVVGTKREDTGWLSGAPHIDVQAAIGSLPRFLRPTLDSFPDRPAYLVPDPERVAFWRRRVEALGSGFKVGICWRSSMLQAERHRLYSQLSQWQSIFGVAGVRFVNLQYDECSAELRDAEQRFGVPIAAFPDIDLRNDIDDSAALTQALDLVISAGTAVAEIAASIGVETWRIDDFLKPWIALGSDRMPWHPTLRWYRQPAPGDWDTPLALVGSALDEKVHGATAAAASPLWTRLAGDVEAAVPDDTDNLASYVLREQEGAFDPGYAFFVGLAGPGTRIVDLDAGYGAYALPMARRATGGKVWAYARGSDEVALLDKSRERNGLGGVLLATAAEQGLTLDIENDRHGFGGIDLLRIPAAASEPAFYAGSRRCLAASAPLVMFALREGLFAHADPAAWWGELGYRVYRLLPGPGVLVPWQGRQDDDVFTLHLFACRPERAEALARAGLLVERIDPAPPAAAGQWQAWFAAQPWMQGIARPWGQPGSTLPGWERYAPALDLYAMADDRRQPAAVRVACLQAACERMVALVSEQANFGRLVTLCRILVDLGRRESAVGLLNQICALFGQGMAAGLDEPLLPLSAEFAAMAPGAAADAWVVAMVLGQRERLRAFSTWFTGRESLAALEELQRIGFLDATGARALALVRRRHGLA